MAARRKSKTGSVKVNFKGVESRKTPPEGDYLLECVECNDGESNTGNQQIAFTFEIAKGEYKGVKVWFYCPLAENSLWKLHALLTAMGEEPPEDEMDIDLSDLVGKQVVGVLTHETYQGKKRAKMTDFDSADNYKGAGDEDDKKSSKKDKDSKKDKKSDKEEKSSKKDKGAKEPEKGKKDKPEKDAGKKKDKAEKVKKYDADDITDMDEDELAAVVKKAKLKVDLDDIKKLKKKQAAVLEALEEADLIND